MLSNEYGCGCLLYRRFLLKKYLHFSWVPEFLCLLYLLLLELFRFIWNWNWYFLCVLMLPNKWKKWQNRECFEEWAAFPALYKQERSVIQCHKHKLWSAVDDLHRYCLIVRGLLKGEGGGICHNRSLCETQFCNHSATVRCLLRWDISIGAVKSQVYISNQSHITPICTRGCW